MGEKDSGKFFTFWRLLSASLVLFAVFIAVLGYLNRSGSIPAPNANDTKDTSLATGNPKLPDSPVNQPTIGNEPILAWAGQRIVLEQDWVDENGGCVWAKPGASFIVHYLKTKGPGAFVSGLGDEFGELYPNSVQVQVQSNQSPNEGNSNCTSHVIFESDEEGEILISASAIRKQGSEIQLEVVIFTIYYQMFQDVTLPTPTAIPYEVRYLLPR